MITFGENLPHHEKVQLTVCMKKQKMSTKLLTLLNKLRFFIMETISYLSPHEFLGTLCQKGTHKKRKEHGSSKYTTKGSQWSRESLLRIFLNRLSLKPSFIMSLKCALLSSKAYRSSRLHGTNEMNFTTINLMSTFNKLIQTPSNIRNKDNSDMKPRRRVCGYEPTVFVAI